MRDKIKPIETTYNGYRFRSRLEARWAVFFDLMNIEYEYEPEGYQLPQEKEETLYYLPDFKLKHGPYVEVKPDCLYPAVEITKVLRFSYHYPIILVEGLPRPVCYEPIYPEDWTQNDWENFGYWGPIPHLFMWHKNDVGNWEFADQNAESNEPQLIAACAAAKQARF